MFCSSATATKYRRWRRSICFQYISSVWRAKQHGISVLSALRIGCERDERSATSHKKTANQIKLWKTKDIGSGLGRRMPYYFSLTIKLGSSLESETSRWRS